MASCGLLCQVLLQVRAACHTPDLSGTVCSRPDKAMPAVLPRVLLGASTVHLASRACQVAEAELGGSHQA